MKRETIICGIILCLIMCLAGCSKGKGKDAEIELGDILDKIREVYGDDYLPDTEMEEEVLIEQFGLDLTLTKAALGEMSTIGFQPDLVILVRSAKGKGEEIEKQLRGAREALLEKNYQYPANIPKAEASQVVRNGDYVAFFLVGAVHDDPEESREEQVKFAKEETQKAVEAFESFF